MQTNLLIVTTASDITLSDRWFVLLTAKKGESNPLSPFLSCRQNICDKTLAGKQPIRMDTMNWFSRGSEPPISFPTLDLSKYYRQQTLVQSNVKLGEVLVLNDPAPGSQEVALKQNSLSSILADQTKRALWEVQNLISCVPNNCWNKEYCQAPLWKHIYHMLHSLDLWLINPRDSQFKEPPFHEKNLSDLDTPSCKQLEQCEINRYFCQIQNKITDYLHTLQDDALLERPQGSEHTRFTLILAQHRHLHTHMGMIMGFIIAETGRWPKVIGLEGEIPSEGYGYYF